MRFLRKASKADGVESSVRDYRWLSVLLLVGAAGIVAAMIVLFGRETAWRILGVLPISASFGDMLLFAGAQETLQSGGQPFVDNHGDLWHRPFNYPTAWLYFMRFDETWVLPLGFLLIFATIGAVLWWWGPMSCAEAILLAGFLCTPPVLLAFERANSDLIVLVLITASLTLSRRGRYVSSSIIYATAAVLKVYPLAGLTFVARISRMHAAVWLGVVGVVFFVYHILHPYDLQAIARNTPGGHSFSYGAVLAALESPFMGADGAAAIRDAGRFYTAVALLAVAVCAGTGFVVSKQGDWLHRGEDLICGAMIYIGTFLVGISFWYRLVFLVLCLPALFAARKSPRVTVRLPALVALAGMGLSSLVHLYLLPASWYTGRLGSWLAAGALAWCVGAAVRGARHVQTVGSLPSVP